MRPSADVSMGSSPSKALISPLTRSIFTTGFSLVFKCFFAAKARACSMDSKISSLSIPFSRWIASTILRTSPPFISIFLEGDPRYGEPCRDKKKWVEPTLAPLARIVVSRLLLHCHHHMKPPGAKSRPRVPTHLYNAREGGFLPPRPGGEYTGRPWPTPSPPAAAAAEPAASPPPSPPPSPACPRASRPGSAACS